jgi:transglutaminase-like putative cysteine protease/Flp pilus assembly protein TadD
MRLRLLLLATSAALAVPLANAIAHAAPAPAGSSDRLTRIDRAERDVVSGDPAMAYARLRELWAEWDTGDPAPVEEALVLVTREPHASAAVKAYAGLLRAYARRRRGDYEGARAQVASLAYVGRWLIAGPFDNEGKAGLDKVYGPEADLGQALDLAKRYDGKERPVSFRLAPGSSPFGWVDLGTMVRPAEKGCVYASTFVRDAKLQGEATRKAEVWLGVAGAMKLFWNGHEMAKDDHYRDLDADREGVPVTVASGWNRLTLKTCGDEAAPLFTLRLAAPGGAPDPSLEVEADVSHAREAAAQTFKKHAGDALHPGAPVGPVPTFAAHATSRDARWLEAYARYLVTTQGDDPALHEARDFARRAAEASPTAERDLLAGELAEGRNQGAVWIERAAALVATGNASADAAGRVLLARAAHARAGIERGDAVHLYEEALARDPDDVVANVARAQLFADAGLKETAAARLQAALARNPRSAALLRATSDALGDLDRVSEAAAIDERLEEVRADTPELAHAHVDLAVARRDFPAALRWSDRLNASLPDNPSSLSFAAHVHELAGDRPAAVTAYKRILELAPEDTAAMRSLADLYALSGRTDEQLALLRRVLEITPQDKDVREYVAHAGPAKPRADEAYARPASEFLKHRKELANGRNKRTFVNLQVTTVFPNGLASRFHQLVFQPLTESAAEDARQYAFAFEADDEAVQLRGARVYHENGQIDEAAETGEVPADDPAIATYTSQRGYVVRFPRVSPGDVVELLYRVEDVAPRNAFADYFGEVAYLQSDEPIAHAEYDLITPKSRAFTFGKPTVPGLIATTTEDASTRTYRFVADNVPPLDPEPHQPPMGEKLGHVHVSTYKTWDDMGAWYWGLAKDQLVVDDEVRRRVREVTAGLTTERDKVRAVYDYVVQKTRYVALEFGIHGFKPYRASQIFSRGFGDCKDKATLIVAMLKELNIPASLVIVRTGNRGDFESFPASLAIFDHAIAYVPSENLFLDGTAEFSGSTELPGMDRNALALVVNEGKPKLVHLPDPPASESVTKRTLQATLAADGSSEVDWRTQVTGVRASSYRARFHAESTRKQRLEEELGTELPGLSPDVIEANKLDDNEAPVDLHVHGKAQLTRQEPGVHQSSAAVGPGEHLVRDYAQLASRRQDLRLDAKTTRVDATIFHLPAGARVIRAPDAAHGESPFGSFSVEVASEGSAGDRATVRVTTTVTLSATRISAADYPAFRAFCEKADRALGQRLTYGSN